MRTATKVAVFSKDCYQGRSLFLRTATMVAVLIILKIYMILASHMHSLMIIFLCFNIIERWLIWESCIHVIMDGCKQYFVMILLVFMFYFCIHACNYSTTCIHFLLKGQLYWFFFYWCLASSTLLATFFQLMITTAVQRNEFNFWYTICLMFPPAKGQTTHTRFPSNLQELKTIIHGRIMQKNV